MACKKVDRKASQNDIFATSFTLCKKSLNLFEFILLEKLNVTFFFFMKECRSKKKENLKSKQLHHI